MRTDSIASALALSLILLPALAAGEPAPTAKADDGRFSVADLDRTADPCGDFYQFACGGWMAANPIPPDRSAWGAFATLAQRNEDLLRESLERVAQPGASRSPAEALVGDFYAACMDEAGIEQRGLQPLAAELQAIGRLASKADLPAQVARLHGLGMRDGTQYAAMRRQKPLFDVQALADEHDAAQVIPVLDAGGIGLPDRDLYFAEDPRSREIREQYLLHVASTLRLLGDAPERAAAGARTVLEIETALAKASLTKTERRDPKRVYNKMTPAELQALSPAFSFPAYLKAIGLPGAASLNVREPEFVKGLSALVAARPLEDWKTYLRWHLAHFASPLLPRAFVDESFDFYGRKLGGASELRPRWKRCVTTADAALGEALGQLYVKAAFGPESRKRMHALVENLEHALADDIRGLDWMGAATKEQALVKLGAITNKIGHPDVPRDYAGVRVDRKDALGSFFSAGGYDLRWALARIGKPTDKNEWQMSPSTVNAYYDPPMNNINFPAGILQPPFFDPGMDDAINYGAIGGVIGHELTHGFDDQGRQYDAQGNLRDWWTPEDGKRFEERAECLVKQYDGFVAVKDPSDPKNDVHLKGRLTLGENAADNGGVRIALMALERANAGKSVAPIDGFTPEQRVFLGWARVWCTNYTDKAARLQALTNEHSLGKYRVNGVVQNMPEFQKAFSCKAGEPMVREDACRIW